MKVRRVGSKLRYSEVILHLPLWIEGLLADAEQVFPTIESRMQLAITLASMNIEHNTGGPFGAGIFERESGRLLAVGVNQVESAKCSIAHAEMLAIAVAQRRIGHYDLGSKEDLVYELVTSTEPCVMCLGAICWSGIGRVICGARDQDAREIGFDEGPKPEDWVRSLERRGISIIQNVLRKQAKAVLTEYHKKGGLIYNSRQRRER